MQLERECVCVRQRENYREKYFSPEVTWREEATEQRAKVDKAKGGQQHDSKQIVLIIESTGS